MKLPFIIIFDIDQTLIGNISHCLTETNVVEMLYKICIKEKDLSAKCPKHDLIDLQDELKGGLLRPNARDFITYCQKKFKHLEIFFYTNSTYGWTNRVLVREIEKALQFKANRPLFTREDSLVGYAKTITNIYPLIQKSLIKKYPLFKDAKHAQKVFSEQMLFIDDITDNVYDFTSRQIVCPEYKFRSYYDIPEKIINKYNLPASLFDNTEVLEYLAKEYVPIYNKNGSIHQANKEFFIINHLYMSKYNEVTNANLTPDTFFIDMIAAFEKISVFTDKEIEKLNKALAP
jgi:hypothetical protein